MHLAGIVLSLVVGALGFLVSLLLIRMAGEKDRAAGRNEKRSNYPLPKTP